MTTDSSIVAENKRSTMNDPYNDQVGDSQNRRMREVSGRIDDSRPLVSFFYVLARDVATPGVIEGLLGLSLPSDESDEHGECGPVMFTNGWLARWAQDVVDRFENTA
jgi:hypothetical protein